MFIQWKVEQPRPKLRKPATYTAFLARKETSTRREEVITKLNRDGITTSDLTGTWMYQGEACVSYPWKAFWYQVPISLCFAKVDYEDYDIVLDLLSQWVKRPTQEEFKQILHDHLRTELNALSYKWKGVQRAMDTYLKKREELNIIV